jgi:hypothetical protein
VGDRTNIADARQHDAEQAAGVIEQAMRNEGLFDKDVRLMGEIITEALDAAGFDVVLRADPDTSDELFTEARRLLDAATPGPWASTGGGFAQPAIVYAPGYEVIEGDGGRTHRHVRVPRRTRTPSRRRADCCPPATGDSV